MRYCHLAWSGNTCQRISATVFCALASGWASKYLFENNTIFMDCVLLGMLQSQNIEASEFLLSLLHRNHSSYLNKKLRKRRVTCRNQSKFKKTNGRKVSAAWDWTQNCFLQAKLWSDSLAYSLSWTVLAVLGSVFGIPRGTWFRKFLWKKGEEISLGKLGMTEQLRKQFWPRWYLPYICKAARKAGSLFIGTSTSQRHCQTWDTQLQSCPFSLNLYHYVFSPPPS